MVIEMPYKKTCLCVLEKVFYSALYLPYLFKLTVMQQKTHNKNVKISISLLFSSLFFFIFIVTCDTLLY